MLPHQTPARLHREMACLSVARWDRRILLLTINHEEPLRRWRVKLRATHDTKFLGVPGAAEGA